ncbi:MAG: restriction endonuclease, partial [Brumimicrobium sp.]
MAKNTGIPYEKLNQQIFSILVNQDSVENVEVEHDVVIEGKTTNHQIDVYWEFKIGGILYSTVVQAKHWDQNVNQGELLKFKAVLDDLPGQPRGIFITSKPEFDSKSGLIGLYGRDR